MNGKGDNLRFRNKEITNSNKKIIDIFNAEFFPASDVPEFKDFIIWLQDNNYIIRKK